jgi:ketosteroid isomerase-like protein
MATAGEDAARNFAEAVTRCDVEAAVALCHPEIVFDSVLGISGRAYAGHDGIREYFDDVQSAWEEWTVDVERISEGPDGRIAIVMTMRARGKESGLTLATRTAHVWTLADGKLLRNRAYRDSGAALRDAGLADA